MPKLRITDLALRALKSDRQETFWDASLPAFGVRVGKNRKTFTVMVGRERERRSIGIYPDISLQDARAKAKRILAEASPTRSFTPTFSEALESFFATHCDQKQRRSTARETKRLLNKHYLSVFRDRSLSDISSRQVQSIIDGLLRTPSEAIHAFRAIRLFFRWARARHHIDHSPCEGMIQPAQARTRDRVLTDEELKLVWNAANSYPFGTIVRLLILTGQRRSEIGSLKWVYIEEIRRTISLPPEIVKNGHRHTFPYGACVQALIGRIPKDNEYLFPSRDGHPFSGYFQLKIHLDKKSKIAHWTLHDLRRTFATNLAALGTPIHVTEKLLNHISGTVSGVAAIYNRHAYMDEMRAAIDAWEKRLSVILAKHNSDDSNGSPPT